MARARMAPSLAPQTRNLPSEANIPLPRVSLLPRLNLQPSRPKQGSTPASVSLPIGAAVLRVKAEVWAAIGAVTKTGDRGALQNAVQ